MHIRLNGKLSLKYCPNAPNTNTVVANYPDIILLTSWSGPDKAE